MLTEPNVIVRWPHTIGYSQETPVTASAEHKFCYDGMLMLGVMTLSLRTLP
jgi:hypothetical protein